MANTFLTGKKTVLRPVALDDIRLLTKWMNDPKTRIYLPRRFPLSEIDERTYVEKMSVLSGTPSNIMV